VAANPVFEVWRMEPKTLLQTTDAMRTFIRRAVTTGFDSPDDIRNSAVEAFSDDHPASVLRPIAERLTREAVEAHRAAQRGWPPVTDCNLLDRAFDELERAGVVSRHNFTCCGT